LILQRKTAYICGKHVSMADPIIDATLPNGSIRL